MGNVHNNRLTWTTALVHPKSTDKGADR